MFVFFTIEHLYNFERNKLMIEWSIDFLSIKSLTIWNVYKYLIKGRNKALFYVFKVVPVDYQACEGMIFLEH